MRAGDRRADPLAGEAGTWPAAAARPRAGRQRSRPPDAEERLVEVRDDVGEVDVVSSSTRATGFSAPGAPMRMRCMGVLHLYEVSRGRLRAALCSSWSESSGSRPMMRCDSSEPCNQVIDVGEWLIKPEQQLVQDVIVLREPERVGCPRTITIAPAPTLSACLAVQVMFSADDLRGMSDSGSGEAGDGAGEALQRVVEFCSAMGRGDVPDAAARHPYTLVNQELGQLGVAGLVEKLKVVVVVHVQVGVAEGEVNAIGSP